MTPSRSARTRARKAASPASVDSEFELVESASSWQLTITLTERLREALAGSSPDEEVTFAVRIKPNLVPGEPFKARLRIRDAEH